MRITDIGLRAAIEKLLPHCIVGGEFAIRVQDDIIARHGARNHDAKAGDRFKSVVTDADIAIESYFGVVLTSLFEDISFYGEEYERDRVSEYFPKQKPYLLTIDPVDGTRYFADGLPIFSTIITISQEFDLKAMAMYVPRDRKFFYAVKGEGAWTTTAEDVLAGNLPAPFTMPSYGNVILLDAAYAAYKEALTAAGFTVCQNTEEYTAEPSWKMTNLRMFYGDVAGRVLGASQLIDSAAEAFLVTEAGGKTNNPVVDPETLRTGLLISAADAATYDKIAAIVLQTK